MKQLLIVLSWFVLLPIAAQKQKDIEYTARRNATIAAMDSLLKNAQVQPGILMKFADQKCKEFHKDTLLMSRIAEFFATRNGQIEMSIERFRELKKEHPKYLAGYFNYANTIHSHGTKVTPEGGLQRDPKYRDLAKAQIDSAKAVAPKSIQPYLAWIGICAPFAFSEAVSADIDAEVTAMNKAFPQADAYFIAADILRNSNLHVQNIPNDSTGQKQKSDWRFLVDQKALNYYEKADVKSMNAPKLEFLTSHYYQVTKSPYLDSQKKRPMFQKGLERAQQGMERFPDNPQFCRLALWHAAELTKNTVKTDKQQSSQYAETAHHASERFISLSKTDSVIGVDYFYDGLVLQYLNRYSEAIPKYRKALENHLPSYDSYRRDSLTAYENLSDCFMQISDFEDATAAQKALIQIKKRRRQYGFSDAYNLARNYEIIGSDTLMTINERMRAYISADSIYNEIRASVDKGEKGFELNEGYTGYGAYLSLRVRKNMDKIMPDRIECPTSQMAETVIKKLEPITKLSDNEKGFLITSYDFLRLYYYKSDDFKESLRMAEAVERIAPGTYSKDVMDAHRKSARKR